MMKIINCPKADSWSEILQRPVADANALEKKVRKILAKVSAKGDKAVRAFTRDFDGVKVKQLLVSEKEIRKAAVELDDALKEAIQVAAHNIRSFHQQQLEAPQYVETMPGVICWRKQVAIEKVGLYIPGGTAPLFSTVLMLGIPAALAGCKEIILCSPPGRDGQLHPALLYAASLVGITKIFKCGGAQAIGAMAYGTQSIPRVYKLFGPGNQYVTAAKQIVQQNGVAIDMPAGPSEVAILADATARPEFVAADLLSQAEHGPDSQVVLVTDDRNLANDTIHQLELQLADLPRKAIAEKALENSLAVIVSNLQEGMDLLNTYAPEHLILCCSDTRYWADKVVNAGSVFIGHYAPESAGDYASGTNHTLPTNGYARAYSGVSVDSFTRKLTFQELNEEGLKNVGPAVQLMAEAEGLSAHARAVGIRLAAIHSQQQ
ncbi:MAG: histidinol dehydrogenase [Bacteroidota bacterium]|jgi:histidinol dehydrogenase